MTLFSGKLEVRQLLTTKQPRLSLAGGEPHYVDVAAFVLDLHVHDQESGEKILSAIIEAIDALGYQFRPMTLEQQAQEEKPAAAPIVELVQPVEM